MVRISDARMSGTSYDCCVLHAAPESFVGAPLALVRSGDPTELDVPTPGRAAWRRPPAKYQDNISQAKERCDLRFLEGTAATPEPEIH